MQHRQQHGQGELWRQCLAKHALPCASACHLALRRCTGQRGGVGLPRLVQAEARADGALLLLRGASWPSLGALLLVLKVFIYASLALSPVKSSRRGMSRHSKGLSTIPAMQLLRNKMCALAAGSSTHLLRRSSPRKLRLRSVASPSTRRRLCCAPPAAPAAASIAASFSSFSLLPPGSLASRCRRRC